MVNLNDDAYIVRKRSLLFRGTTFRFSLTLENRTTYRMIIIELCITKFDFALCNVMLQCTPNAIVRVNVNKRNENVAEAARNAKAVKFALNRARERVISGLVGNDERRNCLFSFCQKLFNDLLDLVLVNF